MNLNEKFLHFSENTLQVIKLDDYDEIIRLGVKLKNTTSNIFFEENISIESTILPTEERIFVGAYTYMNGEGYIRGPVFIGRYCSIGRRVSLGAGMHSMCGLSTHPLFSVDRISSFYTQSEIKELGLVERNDGFTKIESDVWIGDGAVILPSVTIGVGAIIGANAVVTRDVAPYSIVGGAPARIIKERFPEFMKGKLIASEWWEITKNKLKESPHQNIYAFLDHKFEQSDFANYETFSFK